MKMLLDDVFPRVVNGRSVSMASHEHHPTKESTSIPNVGGEKGTSCGSVMTGIAVQHADHTTRRIECTQHESGQRRPVSCNNTTRPIQDRNHCGDQKLMPTKGRVGTNSSVPKSNTTGMLSRVSLISPDTKPQSQSGAPSVGRGLSYRQVQSAARS